MSYRNKTYVIFDADNDMWAYGYMRGWKSNENMDFNFHDAHDINNLTKQAGEDTVKKKLRERLLNTKQALVLIGESTKNLYRFVRWEMEMCQNLDIPIIAVNLNGKRTRDDDLCPRIIRDAYVVHIPFQLKIIQYALDYFPNQYQQRNKQEIGPLVYNDSIYSRLEL